MRKLFWKKVKVATAALAALVVIVTGTVTPAMAGYYTDAADDHKDITFDEMMAADIYDYDTVLASINALNAAVDKSDNEEEVRACYQEMLDQIDNVATANQLCDVEYYTHLDDEEIADRLDQLSNEFVDLADMAVSAISKMVESQYRYIVEEDIGDAAADYEDYEGMTDEEKEMSDEEQDYEAEYEKLSTDSTLTAVKRYNTLAKLYIDLVKVRKEMIAADDSEDAYKTYREYAYEAIYGRDYTVEDADNYHEFVKTYVVDLYDEVTEMILEDYDTYEALWDKDCGDLDDIFTVMENHLADIDPELMTAFNYFKKNHVYYMEVDDTIFETGYTTNLYAFDTPFIYIALYGNFYDYTDVFHEFGHFNQMFHHNECAMYATTSYDVAEIHSQAMELFFLQWADECYGEDMAEMAKLFTMYRMLNSVIDGCLQDEFQARAFELSDEDLTVDNLTKIYRELMGEYGMGGSDATGWVEYQHTFEQPFYYLSYSTSAMAALQIYEMSKEDRAAAIDTYMQLTALSEDVGFCEAMEKVGLKDIMKSGVVEEVCGGLEKSLTEPDTDDTVTPTPAASDDKGGTEVISPTPVPSDDVISDDNIIEDIVDGEIDITKEVTRIYQYAIDFTVGRYALYVVILIVVFIVEKNKKKNRNQNKDQDGQQ